MNYTFDKDVQFDPAHLNEIYNRAFGYKTDGVFVEVGAYDGHSYSHTVGLADIGWRGVYIEPVPELVQKARNYHAKNKNISVWDCACGDFNGTTTLDIDEFSCCGSTINPIVCQNPKRTTVSIRKLDDILEAERIKPGFDLLSIDVEFGECQVLRGFSVARWLPTLIIIELCEQHDEPKHSWAKPAREMCQRLLPPLGYRKVYADMINSIFLLCR